MRRNVDLLLHLPPYIREYREMERIMQTEDPEFQFLCDESEHIKDNQFIQTADEWGISKFERMLGITPDAHDILESRRIRVMNAWNNAEPYTWDVFCKRVKQICGKDMGMSLSQNSYELTLNTHLDVYGQLDELKKLITVMVPANIQVTINNSTQIETGGDLGVGMTAVSMCEMINVKGG